MLLSQRLKPGFQTTAFPLGREMLLIFSPQLLIGIHTDIPFCAVCFKRKTRAALNRKFLPLQNLTLLTLCCQYLRRKTIRQRKDTKRTWIRNLFRERPQKGCNYSWLCCCNNRLNHWKLSPPLPCSIKHVLSSSANLKLERLVVLRNVYSFLPWGGESLRAKVE